MPPFPASGTQGERRQARACAQRPVALLQARGILVAALDSAVVTMYPRRCIAPVRRGISPSQEKGKREKKMVTLKKSRSFLPAEGPPT